MRKQLVNSVEKVLGNDIDAILLLGDIGVFGFRNAFINYPNRVFNIGILEQATISVAAGLAKSGLTPIVHTIAPFLVERCFEQLKIDFGYQQLGGNFISVGNSYDYASLGCTHHCPADVGLLKSIPNFEIIVPGTAAEFDTLFNQTYSNNNPTYFRLSEQQNNLNFEVVFGKANIIKIGTQATIIAVGTALQSLYDAVKHMDVTILYYSTTAPFDSESLINNIVPSRKVILCEPYYEGALDYDIIKSMNCKPFSLLHIGVPHKFMTNYGKMEEHNSENGLTVNSIYEKIKHFINE